MGIDFPEVRVSSLINAQTRKWDGDLLKALFKLEEVQLIEGITLGDIATRDRLIWPHTQSGTYTVKSGYYLLSKEKDDLDTPNTNPEPSQKLWKLIWRLSVPPKVRNCTWRVAKNAIPVKTNLLKRQVLQEDVCDQCKSYSKDVVHALWMCPCLNEVWDADTVWNFRNRAHWDDIQKLILHMEEAGLDLDLFAMTVWQLWHRRNQVRLGLSATPLGNIVACARQQLLDYNRFDSYSLAQLNQLKIFSIANNNLFGLVPADLVSFDISDFDRNDKFRRKPLGSKCGGLSSKSLAIIVAASVVGAAASLFIGFVIW
nr:inactive lrr receptor-like serine/threonine-protein kinase bir2 [Quercus suber]